MGVRTYIQDLLEGKSVASSKVPKASLEQYLAEGLVSVSAHGSRKAIRVRSIDAFRKHLIDSNERYKILEIDDNSTRASMAADTGNSKLISVRSCPGFPVNSFEPVECSLNGNGIVINPPAGAFTFICDWKFFTIPEDVIVMGIENMENFRMVRSQKELFENCLDRRKCIFVSRYPQSSDLRRWLEMIPNNYVHFGDFDLAGIKIFQTEFEKYLGPRASFLIPPDIEARIKSGSSKRYDDQYCNAGDIHSDVQSIQNLINLIHRERKGYDQEGYISRK